tara:strand:- start:8522 stop:8683 length:162 start_codon:yes stop_codon:yes gene_type:complete
MRTMVIFGSMLMGLGLVACEDKDADTAVDEEVEESDTSQPVEEEEEEEAEEEE